MYIFKKLAHVIMEAASPKPAEQAGWLETQGSLQFEHTCSLVIEFPWDRSIFFCIQAFNS